MPYGSVMLRSCFTLALLGVAAVGCSSASAPAPGETTTNGAGGSTSTTVQTATNGTSTSASGGGGIPVDPPCVLDNVYPACEVTAELPSSVVTVIDATDPATVKGRCDAEIEEGFFFEEEHHLVLPEDRDAYPVLLKVSADGFEGSCTYCQVLSNNPIFTTYGVGFSVPYAAWAEGEGRRFARLHVNDPWKIVSGGCGEACAHPCVHPSEGYLEFIPTSCLASFGSGFGVATAAVNPPPANVIIELVPDETFMPCCPYRCDDASE